MRQRRNKNGLNPNELLFCARYVEMGYNGTRAYMSVWPKVKENSAATNAWRLLRNAEVIAEIRRIKDTMIAPEIMSAQEVLGELSRLGTYDIGDITGPDGRMLPLRQMPERVRRAIKSIKRDSKGNVEVTFHEKTPALNLMAKHFKLTSETINIKGKLSLEDLVAGEDPKENE